MTRFKYALRALFKGRGIRLYLKGNWEQENQLQFVKRYIHAISLFGERNKISMSIKA